MVSYRSRRGMSLVEAVCALTLVHAAAAALLVVGLRHFQTIGASFEQLSAQRAAAGVLESYLADARPCLVGERELPDVSARALTDARFREQVRQLEPGLYAVSVEVSWTGTDRPRSLRLETLVARGEAPE